MTRGPVSPCQTDPPIPEPPALALAHARAALERGDAVLVGDRAGVVEWASAGWTRLTGFPEHETLAKPIGHFLAQADLDEDLIEFVAQHYLAGRACALAFPFETFHGRRIDVHLEVVVGRDESGLIDRFVAIAREMPAAPDARDPDASGRAPARSVHATPTEKCRPGIDATPTEKCPPGIDATVTPAAGETPPSPPRSPLADAVSQAIRRARPALARGLAFDGPIGLDPEWVVRIAPGPLARLLDLLLDAATCDLDERPAFVSLATGRLEARRSHHSMLYPIPLRAVARRNRPACYVEIHDTGPHLEAAWRDRGSSALVAREPKIDRLREALAFARDAGIELHVESTPGCGTQALLVLDRA